MSDPSIRISDAERDRAAAELGEHFAQGRLTADEHAERLEQVWSARTRAELVALFGDLPGGGYGPRPVVRDAAPAREVPSRRRPRLPAPLLALAAVLLVVTVLTHLPF